MSKLAELLRSRDVIIHEPTKLKGGDVSAVYINLRGLLSDPRVSSILSITLLGTAARLKPHQRLFGIPLMGQYFATMMSVYDSMPLLCPSTKKRHDLVLEGWHRDGDRVLVVDDVCTTGGTVLEAVLLLRNNGLVVENALVVVDREDGGRERLGEYGVKLHSLLTLQELCQENASP